MVENSKIEWTHHTFNPWIGCTRVSPACDHCYAETWARRYGAVEWGAGKPRKLTSEANWQQPLKWNREAEKTGQRKRVFCASLADVFDNAVSYEWRERLWRLILDTPHLDWLLLTKRIGNADHMLPLKGTPKNVWLGISVVNQREADRDIPKLLKTEANVRFLSMEPLLGPVDLNRIENTDGFHASALTRQVDGNYYEFEKTIDWVIVGGESGKDARPMSPHWARDLRDQCAVAGVPFLFKQWGEWGWWQGGYFGPGKFEATFIGDESAPFRAWMTKTGKKIAGRVLDGREWNEFPVMAA
ncbi:phage Gp37/Gp68 family protein [Limnoglobus roseus]|uniref:Phage Gp37/Gp68 family protein n=1 Tax=Limnoglobus roseus TaxID=2598579 RepID=A0A5C1A963_9BACT|nr:phage Gp37/Gp68 family protein [Limnoglobus roseus]QEL14743.1 hypothetical protein PX52LOC_01637 [Limnoglobus roseus]